MKNLLSLFVFSIIIFGVSAQKLMPVMQRTIARVEKMPNHPKPYIYKDWKQTTIDFDNYIFDSNSPYFWLDSTKRNFPQTTFGFYTAMNDVRMGPKINNGENHEALGALGAVLGATLVGIDKSSELLTLSNEPASEKEKKLKAQSSKLKANYVSMLKNYFNKDNGWNVIMNFTNEGAHIGGGYGNDFWYEVHNNVLFYAVANYYPNEPGFSEIQRTIADQFYRSDSVMGNSYSYSFFDFKNMKPGKNQIPTQEDVAAGYAFILYSAWIKFGDEKYLRAAKNAMNVLYNQKENRFYEAMMPLAAYIGARMNAEVGTNYDIQRFLDWTFNGDAVGREGWGVLAEKWGGYDVSGMLGSTIDHGGYGFLMNTFGLMMPLSAMMRYDPRYARAVGKWALNASNAARFCYPYDMPDSLQAIPQFKNKTKNVIAYEGIIKTSSYPNHEGKTPFAQGDGPQWVAGNPPETMFSLYGSAHVGIFGGTIQKTNVPEILQIDCRKTDTYTTGYEPSAVSSEPQNDSMKKLKTQSSKLKANNPTFLYYNPYAVEKMVKVNVGKKRVDVYDTVSNTYIKRGAKGKIKVSIPADAARILEFRKPSF